MSSSKNCACQSGSIEEYGSSNATSLGKNSCGDNPFDYITMLTSECEKKECKKKECKIKLKYINNSSNSNAVPINIGETTQLQPDTQYEVKDGSWTFDTSANLDGIGIQFTNGTASTLNFTAIITADYIRTNPNIEYILTNFDGLSYIWTYDSSFIRINPLTIESKQMLLGMLLFKHINISALEVFKVYFTATSNTNVTFTAGTYASADPSAPLVHKYFELNYHV